MVSSSTRVIQITNIAPQTTKDQMQTLFGYLGKIDDIRLYPTIRDVSCPVQSRICYVKYYDSTTVSVAQHLTNTVFIDRALIVMPMQSGEIPDEHRALEMANGGGLMPGCSEPRLPSHVSNTLDGVPPNQLVQTHDPKLMNSFLPPYPPLPSHYDARKIEEIRRTVLAIGVGLLSHQQLFDHFAQAGEVKYLRFCTREGDPLKYALVEMTEQESIIKALQLNNSSIDGQQIKVHHATQSISKPQTKSNEAAQREIEEAMCRVKEAQTMISAAIDPVIGLLSKDKRRSRSRSRSRRRSRSRSRSRRSRSRHRSKRSSRTRRSRSRSRHRHRTRSRSRHRSSRRSRSKSRPRASRSKHGDKRDRSSRDKDGDKRDRSSRDKDGDKRDRSSKDKDSDKRDRSPKDKDSDKRDRSPKDKDSDKRDRSPKDKDMRDKDMRDKDKPDDKDKRDKSKTPPKEVEEKPTEVAETNGDAEVMKAPTPVEDKEKPEKEKEKSPAKRDRSRSKKRDRSRSKRRSRSKSRKKRSRSRDRKRSRSRDRKRSRSRRRTRSRDRKRSRSRDRKRSRSRDRKRTRSRERKRTRSRDRKRTRSRDRKRSRSGSRAARGSKAGAVSRSTRERSPLPPLPELRAEQTRPPPAIEEEKNSPDNMDISNSP